MAGTEVVLTEPIQMGDEKVTKLTFRKPTAGDLKRFPAMPQAQTMGHIVLPQHRCRFVQHPVGFSHVAAPGEQPSLHGGAHRDLRPRGLHRLGMLLGFLVVMTGERNARGGLVHRSHFGRAQRGGGFDRELDAALRFVGL
jgi:hypothetical protein